MTARAARARGSLGNALLVLCAVFACACAKPTGFKDGAVIGGMLGGGASAAAASSDRGSRALLGVLGGALIGGLIGMIVADPEAREPDSDGDRVSDVQDNCPEVANRDQQDVNGDGVGDACTPR